MKGVGRICQQTFVDTYSKVACAKLYDRKTPITAADLLNDRVLPLFEQHEVKLLRVLANRGANMTQPHHTNTNSACGRGHRSLAHQDEEPADQRHL